MNDGAKRILVVYDNRGSVDKTRISIEQHLRVLESSGTKHNIFYFNSYEDAPSVPGGRPGKPPGGIKVEALDAVILHNTFLCFRWTDSYFYTWKRHFGWIGELDCLKIAIPQDEYDHLEILDEWLLEWDVSAIFTNFDEQYRKLLHPIMHDRAVFFRCLTGYIDDGSAERYHHKLLPAIGRSNDIVYRARQLPFWFGHLGQMKHKIGDIVASRAMAFGLRCDISTRAEDVILGERWLDFLASSRAVIGCEGGSSVVDRRGEIKRDIQGILEKEPNLTFEEVSERMPIGWDSQRFLTVTPRHFEAVITKTCQVLLEGEYDGVLAPNTHYIPVRWDFSNLEEAFEKIRDERYVDSMVERAYEDIYLSGKYSYREFAKNIEKALSVPRRAGERLGEAVTGRPPGVIAGGYRWRFCLNGFFDRMRWVVRAVRSKEKWLIFLLFAGLTCGLVLAAGGVLMWLIERD